MAPLRRRVSRRVVKSTFQECFEYDIPGFRKPDTKRVSLPLARTRTINIKPKSKEEQASEKTVRDVPKRIPAEKEKPNDIAERTKNIDNVVEIQKSKIKPYSSVITRKKLKNAYMGSDYKRFKTLQVKSKTLNNVPVIKEKSREAKNLESNKALNIHEQSIWQPVVHLEKLQVSKSKSPVKDQRIRLRHKTQSTNRHTSPRSPDLATRLKNALKDPMAEIEDNEIGTSENEITSNMLVDEILPSSRSSETIRGQHSSGNSVRRGRSGLKETVEVFRDDSFFEQPGCDSALEDWPESSSEASDNRELKDNFNSDETASSSALTDWAGPHLSLIFCWQEKINDVTSELRSSFDSLKSIIQEKNSVISALKNKLDRYNENTYHKNLDRILLDFDKQNPENPATMIINSILKYPNSNG